MRTRSRRRRGPSCPGWTLDSAGDGFFPSEDTARVRLLVELTLENEALARAEALATRELLTGSSRLDGVAVGPGVVAFSGSRSLARRLGARLGLARRVSRLIAVGDARAVIRGASRTRLSGSFAIRPHFLTPGGDARALDRLVRATGDSMREACPGAKVELESPSTEFPLLSSGGINWFGETLSEVGRSEIHSRDPQRRRLDRPIGMAAKYARALVNLARVRKGDVVLDPFCGSGGILLEAALAGARPVGIDIDAAVLRIADATVRRYSPAVTTRLIEGDSEDAPALLRRARVGRVAAVVTDLPYGRSTRVAGRTKREIASILVSSSAKLLMPGARLVATTDSPGELERSAARNFRIEERFSLFVHRSLTRHIFVMARR